MTDVNIGDIWQRKNGNTYRVVDERHSGPGEDDRQASQEEGKGPMITETITEFRKQDAIIAEIREKYTGMTVAQHGYKAVRAARIELKSMRCSVENLRKELKADVLERGRLIDAEAKRLVLLLEPIEDQLAAEEKAEDDRKAAELQAIKEAAEKKLQARVDAVVALGGTPHLFVLRAMDEATFQSYLQDVTREAEAREKARVIEEQERARREQEEEAERQRLRAAQEAELARQQEELRIREQELAEVRRAEELKARQLREELEKQQAELRRQQAEAAERERVAQAELRRIEAERAAEESRKEAERLEAERQERIEAAKPELEKFAKFQKRITTAAAQELKKLGSPAWSEAVTVRLQESLEDIGIAVADSLS